MKTSSPSFDYIILSKSHLEDGYARGLYDRAYQFWSAFWKKFWRESGAPLPEDSYLADVFFRQSKIHCLLHQNEFAGMVMQSVYDLGLAVTAHLPYFSHHPESSMDHLRSSGARTLMTHEFLTVDPRWRKSQLGYSLGPILMSVGARTMANSGGEISVAIARKDIGISKLCCELGWVKVQEDVSYKGYPCDVISLRSGAEFVPESLRATLEDLWERRLDLSESVGVKSPTAAPALRLAA